MTRTARTFIHALQVQLQNRLSEDEYKQIMEESLWEYEKFLEYPETDPSLRPDNLARCFAISISFYRAMLSVGMERRTAAANIADATRDLDWSPASVPGQETCKVATYFHSKAAMLLCESAICSRCSRQEDCPCLARLKSPSTRY